VIVKGKNRVLSSRETLGFLGVFLFFLLANFQVQAVSVLSLIVAGVLWGIVFRFKIFHIAIVGLGFSSYIEIFQLINFSPALLICFLIWIRPHFWRQLWRHPKSRAIFRIWSIWFFALFLILVASLLANGLLIQPEGWVQVLKLSLVAPCALTAAAVYTCSNYRERYVMAGVWVLTATLTSVVALLAFSLTELLPIHLVEGLHYAQGRASGTFEDPNLFAAYLLASLGFAYLFFRHHSPWYLSVPLILISSGIAITNSRAAFFALLILAATPLLLLIGNWQSWRSAARNSLLVVLSFFATRPLISIFGFPAWPTPRKEGSPTVPDIPSPQPPDSIFAEVAPQRLTITGDIRFSLWQSAIELWISNPLLGVGLGQFPTRGGLSGVSATLFVHNTFISFLAEAGILGFLVLSIPFLGAAIFLSTRRTHTTSSVLASFLGIITMMNAYNLQNVSFIWVVLGVVLGEAVALNSPRFLGVSVPWKRGWSHWKPNKRGRQRSAKKSGDGEDSGDLAR
jgi:hypothetical protein